MRHAFPAALQILAGVIPTSTCMERAGALKPMTCSGFMGACVAMIGMTDVQVLPRLAQMGMKTSIRGLGICGNGR
jgi:hypothetical protein